MAARAAAAPGAQRWWVVLALCVLCCAAELPLMQRLDAALGDRCFHNAYFSDWWSYMWCYGVGVVQFHFDRETNAVQSQLRVGFYSAAESGPDHHVYRSNEEECLSDQTGELLRRYAEVTLECCTLEQYVAAASIIDANSNSAVLAAGTQSKDKDTFIGSVVEPVPCSYYVTVCTIHTCPLDANGQRRPPPQQQQQQQQHAQPQEQKPQQKRRSPDSATAEREREQEQRALRKNWRKQKIDSYRARAKSAARPSSSSSSSSSSSAPRSGVDQKKRRGDRGDGPSTPTPSRNPPTPDATAPASSSASTPSPHRPQQTVIPDGDAQSAIKERVRSMFYHGYDSYMMYAFPDAELRPLSCDGGPFELVKIPLVTLIDTLDTLVVMGNHSEFRRAVHLVSTHYPSFDLDVNVSVFETTIRVLGGLLSAHLLAIDPLLQIYPPDGAAGTSSAYDGWLLTLATDLGNRLLPAFRTNTGIPYGTVNLRYGVPRGETEIASTAGAGSLIVEFEALSSLTKDRRYGDAAYGATQALFDRRSPIGLLGKHIHTKTGRWFESVSGIGSNSDSFYEYLLKSFLLYRREKMYRMFTDTFAAIKRFVQVGDWFNDVDMFNGKLRRNRVENLAAFWPGLEASLGFSGESSRQLNTLYAVWADLGFLPEEFDNVQWQATHAAGSSSSGGAAAAQHINAFYPLRPELIESTYHQYRATRDRSWLAAGLVFLESLENHTRTGCGHASVTMDVGLGAGGGVELSDTMPSFFLSETCKYLYLLFDEENYVHDRAYIFSTEAHLFDPLQLETVVRSEEVEADIRRQSEADDQEVTPLNSDTELMMQEMSDLPLLPTQCPKTQWWDSLHSYDANFIQVLGGGEGSGGSEAPTGQARKQQALRAAAASRKGARRSGKLGRAAESSKPRIRTTKNAKRQPSPFPTSGAETTARTEIKWKSNLLKEWASRSRSLPFAQLLPFLGIDEEEAEQGRGALSQDDDAESDVSSSGDRDEGDTEDEENQRAEAEALHQQRQRSVVAQLVATAQHALELEQRRDLSQLHANLYGSPAVAPDLSIVGGGSGRRRRVDACYPDDEPSSEDLDADGGGNSSGHDRQGQPLQTVDVSMGALGDFSVQVYSDGFVVHSKVWGDTLEISNVGQPVMFVRDSNAESVKTVIGSVDGRVVTCSVSVVEPDSEVGELPLWERACSVAAFGPVSLEEPLYATLALDDDVFVGPSSTAEPKSGSDAELAVGARMVAELDTLCKPLPTAPATPEPRRSWWPFGGGGGGKAANAAAPFKGRVAISRRGDCMFEDKMGVAEAAGSPALIVVNDKDVLFLMSSKKQPDPASATTANDGGGIQEDEKVDEHRIPTVMLTKSDGASLLATVRLLRRRNAGFVPRVRLALTAQAMVLDTTLMGAASYPKLRMRQNIIYVLGRGVWGAVLTSNTGLDWQLFITTKAEMDLNFTPGNVLPDDDRSEGSSQRVRTFWGGFTTNPVELYSMILSRQCPSYVKVDDSLGAQFGKAASDSSTVIVSKKR